MDDSAETAAELRRELDLANFILSSVSMVILRWDTSGIIRYLNEFGERLFGYTSNELVGRHVVGSLVPETETSGRDLERMMKDMAVNFAPYETNENENLCKDGTRRWITWRNAPILDENGQFTEILSTGIDISERKKLEQDLHDALAMSAPVIQIKAGVLLLPIVGILDSQRAKEIMESCLARVAATQAKVCILDISGVAFVDVSVADALLKVVKAAQLMGCRSMISGISPASAEAMIELGADLGEVETTGTLMEALASVFGRVGLGD